MLNKNTFSTSSSISEYPERVLQFGTGVLLRGLCDFLIDKANKKGIYQGKIVVVKTTGPDVSEFSNQDNLYTVCVRGIDNGKPFEENVVIESISRVLSTKTHWEEVLKTAESQSIDLVISNTTEVGLQYVEENITDNCPDSFPGKLTAWLYRRYNTIQKPTVVIPTELLVDNGKVLQEAVLKHVKNNKLGSEFENWINTKVRFCSSLVDRIVPGKPVGEELTNLYDQLGYEDKLILKAEVYKLWAIEGENLEDTLGFAKADKGVVISPNIEKYRELKLRMLNATHTLMCGMAFLSGFSLVKDALHDEMMEKYLTILMLTELGPSIPMELDIKTTHRYGREVMDRFRNPYIEHQWISITLQYTTKMRMRAIPLLINYYKTFETVPQYFARCFAAYLLFMKVDHISEGRYFGVYDGQAYPINCDSAEYFKTLWEVCTASEVVSVVLKNKELWGYDLSTLKDFESNVSSHLSNMIILGVKDAISALNVYA